MNRTKITAHSDRSVSLTFISADTGEEITMDIYAPEPGAAGMSYVRAHHLPWRGE